MAFRFARAPARHVRIAAAVGTGCAFGFGQNDEARETKQTVTSSRWLTSSLFHGKPFFAGQPVLCELKQHFTAKQKETMKDINFKQLLKSSGFMAQVPEAVIGEIVEKSGEKLFAKKGQTIIEQGQVNEHLFVVGSGQISIVVDGRQVATVGKGALVGEGSLVAKALANATCQGGADNTCILKIPHSAIIEQLAEVPEVLSYLEEESNKRHTQNLSADLLAQVPAFEDASGELQQELIKALKFVSYVQGAYLVEAGKADDKGMLLIKSGKVGAYTLKEAKVAEYGKNDYFGDLSIFSNINEKRELTMKAEGFVEAFHLSRAEFLRVASKFPDLLLKMKSKAVVLRRASQKDKGE